MKAASKEVANETDLQAVLAGQRSDTGMYRQAYRYLLCNVVDDGHVTLGQWCSRKRYNVERNGVKHGQRKAVTVMQSSHFFLAQLFLIETLCR